MPSETSNGTGSPSSDDQAAATQRSDGHLADGAARPWAFAVGVGVAVTAAAAVAAVVLPGRALPVAASSTATDAAHTIRLYGLLAAPVLGAVVGTAAASLIGRRTNNLDEPPPDAPPASGRPATMVGFAFTAVLVVAVVAWGLVTLTPSGAATEDPLTVRVTGHQWVWTFAYSGTKVVGTNLVLPVGRSVAFEVTSSDVTHGFHPVGLGTQVEAAPGVTTELRVTPNKLGPLTVQCTQLCGLLHSAMVTHAEVVTPSAFARWLVTQGVAPTVARTVARVGP